MKSETRKRLENPGKRISVAQLRKNLKLDRNERTGKRARSIAGRLFKALEGYEKRDTDDIGWIDSEISINKLSIHRLPCTIGQLKTLCASALTQSPDKPKPKPKSKRK